MGNAVINKLEKIEEQQNKMAQDIAVIAANMQNYKQTQDNNSDDLDKMREKVNGIEVRIAGISALVGAGVSIIMMWAKSIMG